MMLAAQGAQVCYVTTGGVAGEWSHYTGEQYATHRQLLLQGIEVITSTAVDAFDGSRAGLVCIHSDRQRCQDADALVLLTSREPEDALYQSLVGQDEENGASAVQRIGDCRQPGLIAHAVHSGHKAARELGALGPPACRRDRVES